MFQDVDQCDTRGCVNSRLMLKIARKSFSESHLTAMDCRFPQKLASETFIKPIEKPMIVQVRNGNNQSPHIS